MSPSPPRSPGPTDKGLYVATLPGFVVGRTVGTGIDGVFISGAQPYAAFDAKLKELLRDRACCAQRAEAQLGSGRGAWYVLQTPDGRVDEPDELASLIAARRGGSLPAAPMATRGPR